MLALAPHVVGVGTWRNSKVSVSINISEKRPDVSGIAFDVINECTIQIDTGRLVLAGCTDYFPDAERFQLVPGPYNVLIGYKGLRTISKNGLDGDDSYHLYLWSGAPT